MISASLVSVFRVTSSIRKKCSIWRLLVRPIPQEDRLQLSLVVRSPTKGIAPSLTGPLVEGIYWLYYCTSRKVRKIEGIPLQSGASEIVCGIPGLPSSPSQGLVIEFLTLHSALMAIVTLWAKPSVAHTTTSGELGSRKGHCWYLLKTLKALGLFVLAFWPGSFCSLGFNSSCACALLAPVRVAATVNRGPRRSFLLCVASGRCGRRAWTAQPCRRVLVRGGCGDTLLGVCASDCELPSLHVHES